MSDTETDTDSDDNEFQQDIEALRRACSLPGLKSIDDVIPMSAPSTVTLEDDDDDDDDDDDLFDDMELLKNIKKRFSKDKKGEEEVVMKPLNTILPDVDDYIDDDDYGGDFETLRAIQRRFSQYNDCTSNGMEGSVQRSEKQAGATKIIDLGKESSPNLFVTRNNKRQGFPDSVDGRAADNHISSNLTSATNVSEGHEPVSEIVPAGDVGFAASAQVFVEAIKKNRAYQKFLRDKLILLEARLEENKKLRERVKFLKSFQVDCRKRTGRALSQKKDPRFQLISVPKLRANASKTKDTRTHPINQGPAHNLQVPIYNEARLKYPDSLSREPWSKADKVNLRKGIKQQIQEMMMQNLFSAENPDSSNLDRVIKRIKKREITPKEIRSFLPQVNWEQLASMYLTGRSGPECESRWRNCEDPLINRGQWTNVEEKKMLHCFSNRGFSNWIDIAKELKTNRTPYQCLSRFQRSLNPSILNTEWTPTEDEELRKAVAYYGVPNWQAVASVLSGRTGTQCSNRWMKSLNRKKRGRWSSDENKHLKLAVRLFGAKNWNKITKFVPGRTQEQCRERWVNCLDPSLKTDKWTEEEDMKLKAIVEEHNYSWTQVAARIPPRTDNQCRRRWRALLPDQASVLKAAKDIKKRYLVSNFVEREGERPQLTYKDFIPLLLESGPKANEDNIISKDKKRRGGPKKVAHTGKAMTLVDTISKDKKPRGRPKKVAHAEKAMTLGDIISKDNKRRGRPKKVADTEKAMPLVDIISKDKKRRGRPKKVADTEKAMPLVDIISKDKKRRGRPKKVAHTGKAMTLVDEDNIISKDKKRRGRPKKVAHTGKAMTLVDEDDVENNDGQADITNNGDEENREVEKEDSVKSQGKERSFKVWTRRSRQVSCTTKVLNLMDEDIGEENHTHSDITSNGRLTRQSVKNKAKASLKDPGLLELGNGEGIRTFGGDNCEIKKKPTRKRKWKPRGNDEHEEMDENCEPGPILKKKSTKEGVFKLIDEDDGHGDITSKGRLTRQSLKNKANTLLNDAGLLEQGNGEGIRTFDGDNCEIKKKPTQKRKQRVNDEHEEIDENWEPGPISKKSVVASSVPLMIKDVPSRVLRSMSGDGSQAKTLQRCKMSCKLPDGTNENHSRGRKRNTDIKISTRKRKAVDGSCGFGEIVLEDEEPLANFVSKRNTDIKISTRKRKSVDGSGGFGEIVLEDEETFANFVSKLKKEES